MCAIENMSCAFRQGKVASFLMHDYASKYYGLSPYLKDFPFLLHLRYARECKTQQWEFAKCVFRATIHPSSPGYHRLVSFSLMSGEVTEGVLLEHIFWAQEEDDLEQWT